MENLSNQNDSLSQEQYGSFVNMSDKISKFFVTLFCLVGGGGLILYIWMLLITGSELEQVIEMLLVSQVSNLIIFVFMYFVYVYRKSRSLNTFLFFQVALFFGPKLIGLVPINLLNQIVGNGAAEWVSMPIHDFVVLYIPQLFISVFISAFAIKRISINFQNNNQSDIQKLPKTITIAGGSVFAVPILLLLISTTFLNIKQAVYLKTHQVTLIKSSDELLYSTNNNPIGIMFHATVRYNNFDENSFLYINGSEISPYCLNCNLPHLEVVKNVTSIEPSFSNKEEKARTYDVTFYFIPENLFISGIENVRQLGTTNYSTSSTEQNRSSVDLKNACFDGEVEPIMDSLRNRTLDKDVISQITKSNSSSWAAGYLKIYADRNSTTTRKEGNLYWTQLFYFKDYPKGHKNKFFTVITKNKYTNDFYQTLINENVKECMVDSREEIDLIYDEIDKVRIKDDF